MAKKIATEIKIGNFLFNGKVGTLDKSNPNSIYIELGTFLTPQYEEESYEELMKTVEKKFKRLLLGKVLSTCYFEKDYICVFEISSDRMKLGKRSFLSIQCHFKPKEITKLMDMYDASISNFVDEISFEFAQILEENYLWYSKTKKAA